MKKLSLLLMLGTVLTPWSANATDCVATPDCASLGYTKNATDCKDKIAVKCPTDNTKVFCKEKEALKSQLPILYGDGTVSKELVAGKTPIGVVFDEAAKLAVALTIVDHSGQISTGKIPWTLFLAESSSQPFCMHTELSECDYTTKEPGTCAPDGQENTKRILETTEEISAHSGTVYKCKERAYAAMGCTSYAPSACSQDFCKNGKWFLPSMNELEKIYNSKTAIASSLNTLSAGFAGINVTSNITGNYCSSNKGALYNIWELDMDSGTRNKELLYSTCYLRPIIYYVEPKVSPTAELPLLYGDGTVSKEILSGKTPIGVVFDTANRLAVALTDVKKDGTAGSETMEWSSSYCDTPGLQNCTATEIPYGTNLTPITCGVDGRLNTNAILASSCNGTTYAATATNNYQPTGCTKDFCKKSKWFLPSFRDLQNIYLQKTQVEASLTLLKSNGATDIGTKYYWSSTEYNGYGAWLFTMSNGFRNYYTKNSNRESVRPVIAY